MKGEKNNHKTQALFGAIVALLSFDAKTLYSNDRSDSELKKTNYTLQILGEGGFTTLSDSPMNPSNILRRREKRSEVFSLISGKYKVLGGKIGTELRIGYKYEWGEKKQDLFTDKYLDERVNQLYYSYTDGPYSIVIGRKKIRWGVAYSYSPTDLINQFKNPEDPEDRLFMVKGRDVVQTSYVCNNDQIDIVYMPGVDWSFNGKYVEDNAIGLRWYRFADPFDLAIVGKAKTNGGWAAGCNAAVAIGNSLELHAEYLYDSENQKKYPDQNTASESFGHPYFFGKKKCVHNLVVGGQYTFDKINLTLEHIFRSSGYTGDEFVAYANRTEYLNQQMVDAAEIAEPLLYDIAKNYTLPMRKHYLFTRLYVSEVFSSVSFDINTLINYADGSGLLVFMPKYNGGKNYEVYCRIEKFWGGNDTEFGLVPDDFSAFLGFSYFMGS
ncbi:MAG TPA: hypothetical protein ENK99_08025 [Campylobacterales bacterium]|nr:hypothetical protein [Campylobacterales bacterium]